MDGTSETEDVHHARGASNARNVKIRAAVDDIRPTVFSYGFLKRKEMSESMVRT